MGNGLLIVGQDRIVDRLGRPGRPAAVSSLKAWAQTIAITIAILAAVGACAWVTLASLASVPA